MTIKTKLKLCPFCGCSIIATGDNSSPYNQNGDVRFFAKCTHCNVTMYGKTQDNVLFYWNRRLKIENNN